ncbi:MAG TPA: DUF308 domain-containing protein [Candidatus Pullichristensenella excrementipullorum]|nr:DUF308 domain-containing protein [Candidatus Pullichristensenella excrementipullorum]
MRNRGTLRTLSIVAGVLLIIAGIICLCHQETAALSAGILLGVFMLVSGVVEIALFIWGRDFYFGSAGLLLDGILTVLLSLFLLFNRAFTLLSLPVLFAMWLMFSGVMRIVGSVELRALGMRRWGWITLLGVILLAAGFIGLMDPWLGVQALGVTLGLCFILEGLDSIVSGLLTGR